MGSVQKDEVGGTATYMTTKILMKELLENYSEVK